MENIRDYFYVTVTKDHMLAKLHCTDKYTDDLVQLTITKKSLYDFLKSNKIRYGYNENNIQLITAKLSSQSFPLIVAEGVPVINGEDGKMIYEADLDTTVQRSEDWDFREVMRIPTMEKGDKLARVIPPTDGKNGKNVYGNVIKARPGKPQMLKPGKNVSFNEKDQSYYATADGQISITNRFIEILQVYEVNESISMKIGNIDFVGSVHVHGNVPTGFTIKADGDIKIFGMVDAATLIAKGSIYIYEGFAGLKSGLLEAGECVHVGYINQGQVKAGSSIFVENTILHSQCTAEKDIICRRGNIIGGIIHAGNSVKVKDVGNRMNTKTEFFFKKTTEKEQSVLIKEKQQVQQTLHKISLVKRKLESEKNSQERQKRINLLKLRHSEEQLTERLNTIDQELVRKERIIKEKHACVLQVRGTAYANTIVTIGKYKRQLKKNYDFVQIKQIDNEVAIVPL